MAAEALGVTGQGEIVNFAAMRIVVRKPMLIISTMLVLSTFAQAAENADVLLDKEGSTSFAELARTAIFSDNTELFASLMKAGLQINRPMDEAGKELALHTAVTVGQMRMIKFLLDHGADRLIRDADDKRAIDLLTRSDGDVAPIIELLKREPTDAEKKVLMGIPVPVWREVLGRADRTGDSPGAQQPVLPKPPKQTFISIKGKDPTPEMKPMLDAHYLGWQPDSRSEYVEPQKGESNSSLYRHKQTHQRGAKVQITIVPSSSKKLAEDAEDMLVTYLRKQNLPAYEFKVRRATGPALSGGGSGGFVVQLAGYWIKVGVRGWDE